MHLIYESELSQRSDISGCDNVYISVRTCRAWILLARVAPLVTSFAVAFVTLGAWTAASAFYRVRALHTTKEREKKQY